MTTQTPPLIRDVSEIEDDMSGPGDVCGRFAPRRPAKLCAIKGKACEPDCAAPAGPCEYATHSAPYSDRSKATNPKDAVGTGKVPFSTVPARPVAEIGLAMLEGARKYGRHNYRVAGVRASVYYDAALRHLTAWWEGQDIDPDSGLPPVVKAMACLVVLRDAELNLMLTDDRPPPIANAESWIADLSNFAKQIIARYPDAKDPYTR